MTYVETCDRCNMKIEASVFWEWHKVEGHVVMCANGAGKPYDDPWIKAFKYFEDNL